jgi:hypothetical protein
LLAHHVTLTNQYLSSLIPSKSTVLLTTRRRAWNKSAIHTSTGLLVVSPGWNWLASEP